MWPGFAAALQQIHQSTLSCHFSLTHTICTFLSFDRMIKWDYITVAVCSFCLKAPFEGRINSRHQRQVEFQDCFISQSAVSSVLAVIVCHTLQPCYYSAVCLVKGTQSSVGPVCPEHLFHSGQPEATHTHSPSVRSGDLAFSKIPP